MAVAFVPRWVRGAEYAVMRSPRNKTLHFAGLGGSIGTGGGEIVAPALVVADVDPLPAPPPPAPPWSWAHSSAQTSAQSEQSAQLKIAR